MNIGLKRGSLLVCVLEDYSNPLNHVIGIITISSFTSVMIVLQKICGHKTPRNIVQYLKFSRFPENTLMSHNYIFSVVTSVFFLPS